MRIIFPTGHQYPLEIVDGPILNADGEKVLGLITYDDRPRVDIDRRISPSAIVETVHHEEAHGWLEHLPPPCDISDEEKFCDWLAIVLRHSNKEWAAQGGHPAMLGLKFDNLIRFDPDALTRTLAGLGVDRQGYCGYCEQRIAPGMIAVSKPRRSPMDGSMIADMAFSCPSCDRVTRWAEQCGQGGRPTGACALEPEYLEEDQARAFREAHPDKICCHFA